ncbi:MAG: aspartate/glutamate racemase family protein [Ilumatobacteraceae bacterium]
MSAAPQDAEGRPRRRQVVRRGQTVYGIDIGVIMLDNDLPRPVGDVGNARTFAFPVAYQEVAGCTPSAITSGAIPRRYADRPEAELSDYIAAGRALIRKGVRALATCCGLLAAYQSELTEALPVPVAASSLLQVPLVLAVLAPQQRLCILTVNSQSISQRHLHGCGIDDGEVERLRIVGLEHSEHFYPALLGRLDELDPDLAEDELVDVARRVVSGDPDIGGFLLECTNMPPYAAALRRATGLPVWDAVSLINWVREGVAIDA